MNRISLLTAGAAAVIAASSASAATSLVYAEVNGASGAVWDTEVDGNWALFLQQPFGNVLNPNDNFGGNATEEGMNNFLIAGEGYFDGTSANSDLTYNLLLRFADGATISGQYTFGLPGGGFVAGPNSTATVGNTTYVLNGFGWDRSRADNVSRFQAVSGGDPFDYTGQFSFTATTAAVPEPATWALFILGFGAIGATLRRRSSAVRVSKTKLRFA